MCQTLLDFALFQTGLGLPDSLVCSLMPASVLVLHLRMTLQLHFVSDDCTHSDLAKQDSPYSHELLLSTGFLQV
jgi:hypothetical protein